MTDLRQAAKTLQVEVVKLKQMLEQQQAEPVAFITPLMEQQMFEDWCPYDGNPDPRTVWAAAIEAVNGLLLGASPPQQQSEPTCPDCKAAVLYECVACSSNNYPLKQPAEPKCWCHKCNENRLVNNIPFSMTRMIVCPTCGNKRCPKASDHRLDCTGSNETGQPGSVYTTPPQRQWVGLTDEEINANRTLRYHFSLNNGPVTRAGIAVVETIEAMLKAKNHG